MVAHEEKNVQSTVAKWIKSAYKSRKLFANRMRHNIQLYVWHWVLCSLFLSRCELMIYFRIFFSIDVKPGNLCYHFDL